MHVLALHRLEYSPASHESCVGVFFPLSRMHFSAQNSVVLREERDCRMVFGSLFAFAKDRRTRNNKNDSREEAIAARTSLRMPRWIPFYPLTYADTGEREKGKKLLGV